MRSPAETKRNPVRIALDIVISSLAPLYYAEQKQPSLFKAFQTEIDTNNIFKELMAVLEDHLNDYSKDLERQIKLANQHIQSIKNEMNEELSLLKLSHTSNEKFKEYSRTFKSSGQRGITYHLEKLIYCVNQYYQQKISAELAKEEQYQPELNEALYRIEKLRVSLTEKEKNLKSYKTFLKKISRYTQPYHYFRETMLKLTESFTVNHDLLSEFIGQSRTYETINLNQDLVLELAKNWYQFVLSSDNSYPIDQHPIPLYLCPYSADGKEAGEFENKIADTTTQQRITRSIKNFQIGIKVAKASHQSEITIIRMRGRLEDKIKGAYEASTRNGVKQTRFSAQHNQFTLLSLPFSLSNLMTIQELLLPREEFDEDEIVAISTDEKTIEPDVTTLEATQKTLAATNPLMAALLQRAIVCTTNGVTKGGAIEQHKNEPKPAEHSNHSSSKSPS